MEIISNKITASREDVKNHLRTASPSMSVSASTRGRKSATLAETQQHRAFPRFLEKEAIWLWR